MFKIFVMVRKNYVVWHTNVALLIKYYHLSLANEYIDCGFNGSLLIYALLIYWHSSCFCLTFPLLHGTFRMTFQINYLHSHACLRVCLVKLNQDMQILVMT